jgi:hypothetical protein
MLAAPATDSNGDPMNLQQTSGLHLMTTLVLALGLGACDLGEKQIGDGESGDGDGDGETGDGDGDGGDGDAIKYPKA